MTGMGFDGLVVNHGGLNEITDHLYKMVKDIDDRMNRLESELARLGHLTAMATSIRRAAR